MEPEIQIPRKKISSQITPSSSHNLLLLLPDMIDLASHHSFRANALLEDCLRLMLLLFEAFPSVSFLTLPSQLQYDVVVPADHSKRQR